MVGRVASRRIVKVARLSMGEVSVRAACKGEMKRVSSSNAI